MQCNTSTVCEVMRTETQSFLERASCLTVFTRWELGFIPQESCWSPELWEAEGHFQYAGFRYLSDKFLPQTHTTLTHSTHHCINRSLHCQQRGIPFSIFCRRMRHYNTSPHSCSAGNFPHNASHHAIKDNNGARQADCFWMLLCSTNKCKDGLVTTTYDSCMSLLSVHRYVT